VRFTGQGGLTLVEHKKQHYVPRSYLAAWCDPDTPPDQEPYVWRCLKDGSVCQRKAPQNIFHETDMYTLHMPDGSRDLRLERGLAGLEGSFVTIRSEKLDARVELSPTDRVMLLAFIAAMGFRTPKQRDHWKAQGQNVVDMMNKMRDAVMKMTPEQRKKIPPTVPSGRPNFDQSVA